MKNILLIFTLCFSLNTFAQTYSCMNVPGAIPDSNTTVSFPINVIGLPSVINSSYGISSVLINISHAQVSDLRVSLTSPNGTNSILSLHNGGIGANFTNTTFRMNAFTPISLGSPPFTGQFIPDNSLNAFNNNQNPNGTWTLDVIDVFPTVSGTMVSASITFTANPPPDPGSGSGCSITNSGPCVCKDSTLSSCDLFPDLIVSAKIIRDGWAENSGTVSMPNAVINIGSGPIEMKPTGQCFCDTVPVSCTTTICPSGLPPRERVRQRIYHKNSTGGAMTYTDQPGGYQSFHPTHGHVHAEDFCEFTLRVATSNPDPTTWPILGYSLKQGYCMINMGNCDSQDSLCMSHGVEITNAMLPNLNLGVVTGCGSNGQGIFVGRYDLYGAGFGQTIQVPGLCNGNYYIVTTIDPNNNYVEEDETNNSVAVPVSLTQQAGTALNASFTYGVSGMTAGFFNYTFGVTKTWDFGDGTPPVTIGFPTHTYANPGTYLVSLTVFNGTCSTTSYQTVIIGTTSINEPGSIESFNLYPNPTSGDFTVSIQSQFQSKVTIELLNIIGEKVMTVAEGNYLAGENNFTINNIAKGTYFVKMVSGDNQVIKKLVKL